MSPQKPRPARSLQRILAIRVVVVCLIASVALTGYVFVKYMLDIPGLRQRTLAADATAVAADLARGKDPARWPQFVKYPNAYGVRVFDRRAVQFRKLVMQANPHLLPPLVSVGSAASDYDLTEELVALSAGTNDEPADRWLFTDHIDLGGHSYWVQLVMVGDPAWLWWGIMEGEMRDHVMVPVLFLIPALMLAMLLTIRHSLEPLMRVSRRAASLSGEIETGTMPSPLPVQGLPAEVRDLVLAINAMSHNLDQLFRRQKQFASDVAHELRTPLAVMLLETSQLEASQAREAIADEVKGLIGMVNQLLRLAQAEDAMLRERHATDLVTIVRAVCEDMADQALANRQLIEFDAPERAVTVLGHTALIDIAVRNVIDNALRLSPTGATISVVVDTAGRVSIDDRGPGVPDKHKTLIFERFWRANSRRGGSGIGLALVSRIVRLHGGSVRVEDRPGGTGARFVLSFGPVDRPMARAARTRRLLNLAPPG